MWMNSPSVRAHRFLQSLGNAVVVGIALASAASTQTLRVGPTRLYTDIQSAVDIAPPGAVILVDPGVYAPFIIVLKGVTVQGEPTFTVDDTSGSGLVRILAVPSGQRTAIRGMNMVGVRGGVGLEAEFSPGEILIEKTTISDAGGFAYFKADSCSNLFVSDLSITGSSTRLILPTPVPLLIRKSTAALSSVEVTGGGTYVGLRLENDARVVLAGPRIRGADGVSNSSCLFQPNGGPGGAAVVLQDSRIIVTGDSTHFLVGGDGSEGSPCGKGGSGGPGIQLLGSSTAVVPGRVVLLGGKGAPGGTGSGANGLPSQGPVDRSQELPTTSVTELRLGATMTVVVDAVPSSAAPLTIFVLLSGTGGFLPRGAFGGPPQSAFLVPPFSLRIESADPSGNVALTFNIPPDPVLLGFALFTQALAADPTGPSYLSNVVVRGVGN